MTVNSFFLEEEGKKGGKGVDRTRRSCTTECRYFFQQRKKGKPNWKTLRELWRTSLGKEGKKKKNRTIHVVNHAALGKTFLSGRTSSVGEKGEKKKKKGGEKWPCAFHPPVEGKGGKTKKPAADVRPKRRRESRRGRGGEILNRSASARATATSGSIPDSFSMRLKKKGKKKRKGKEEFLGPCLIALMV